MSYDIRRTLYPAMRLWRAEIKAGLDGQTPSDPATFVRDVLWRAAECEAEAWGLAEFGELAAAEEEVRRARAAFLSAEPFLDSHYRAALHERAVRRLGPKLATALALKHRTHRTSRLPPSDYVEQIARELPRARRAHG